MLDDRDITRGLRAIAQSIDLDAPPVDLSELSENAPSAVGAPRELHVASPTARTRQSGLVAAAAAVIVVVGGFGLAVATRRDAEPAAVISPLTTQADNTEQEPATPSTDSPQPEPPAPATALQPPEGYLRSMNTARETAIQRCMTEKGFDYRPSPNLEDIPTDGSDFVEFDEWDAWRTNQLTGTPGFKLALFGVDGDGPDSCTGSANDTVFGAVSAEALATQLQADRYEQARMVARRDDSLTQLRTDLATCTNQAGYPTGSGADELFETIDAAVLAGFEPVTQCETYPDLLTRLDPLIETQLQAWDKQNPNRYSDVVAEWDEDMSRFQDIIEQTAPTGP